MRFSRRIRSSRHCLPSPDGSHVATLFQAAIHVRSARSLQVVNTIKLPKALTGPISRIGWSPSSTLLLVSSGEQIDVFSALDGSFHAAINDIVPVAAKVTSVGFAASDTEIYVCSSLGLKITFHDLTTSQTVELANPKFSTPATAQNGFSFRPKTGHLAFLSRVSGKDIVSLHGVPERRVLSSWFPDTVDAAGLAWSPDGKWLAVRESAAQGHKVVFYTADGHVFKSLPNSADPASAGLDSGMTSGIKMMRFSQDGRLLAIANTSRHVAILDMKTITSRLQLSHPVNVEPGDKLQVWQEQATSLQAAPSTPTFIRATQTITPPAWQQADRSEAGSSGCSAMAFDASATLLATQLDEHPGTVWIWDVKAAELRAVLVCHSQVTSVSWHPCIREVLFVQCRGDQRGQIACVWDPLQGPQVIDIVAAEGPKPNGPFRIHWLALEGNQDPVLFAANDLEFLFISLQNATDAGPAPWQQADADEFDSLLGLDPTAESRVSQTDIPIDIPDDEEDFSEVDDTFHYRKDQG